MKIEFKWEVINEHDESWDELFVRINDGKWKNAMNVYETDDYDEIVKIIDLPNAKVIYP